MRNHIQALPRKTALCLSALCVVLACASAPSVAQSTSAAALPDAPSFRTVEPDQAVRSMVQGTVQDTAGALVSGAKVQLVDAAGATLQQTTSGSDGNFAFTQVPPGPLVLRVMLRGFDPANTAITVEPGQVLQVKPVALRISTAKVEVDVKGPAEASGEDEVHVEETQRLFGFLPNFYVSYDWTSPPLSVREKFQLAGRDMIDPGNLLLVGTVAGVQQAANSFPGYGQGAAGYGKRYGADYANLEVGTLLGEAVLPSLLHQDPRYFYKGTGSVRQRVLYALSFGVVRRGDNGRRQFAYAGVLGDLSAGAVSNLYYPASDRHGAELTFENGLLGIAGDALNGLFQEFFARKVTPHALPATSPAS